jgi:hypothetical protein
MALLFLLPKFFWHAFTRQGGLNIRRLIQMIKDKPDAEKAIEFVNKVLKRYLDTQNTLHGTICCGFRIRNFYIGYTLMYFTVKILYVLNALTQFFLLNAFLSFNFTGYGVEAINKLFSGDDWFESPRFPRVTMCDFMIRHLGSNQHWYAIQCNLPINIYNEKIFLGIWIWLLVLTVLNIVSIILWIISLSKRRRLATIKRYLKINRATPKEKKEKKETEKEPLISSSTTTSRLEPFIRPIDYDEFTDYMHVDGFLIFDIFARNTDDLVAGQIIEHLYSNFVPPTRSLTSNV